MSESDSKVAEETINLHENPIKCINELKSLLKNRLAFAISSERSVSCQISDDFMHFNDLI